MKSGGAFLFCSDAAGFVRWHMSLKRLGKLLYLGSASYRQRNRISAEQNRKSNVVSKLLTKGAFSAKISVAKVMFVRFYITRGR